MQTFDYVLARAKLRSGRLKKRKETWCHVGNHHQSTYYLMFYLLSSANGSVVEGLQHTEIRRDLAQRPIAIVRPQIRMTLSGECVRDPRVLVIKVPDGDAHATGNIKATPDRVLVVERLLREIGGGRRVVLREEANVELGDGHVEVERGEVRLCRDLIGAQRDDAGDEVRLDADAVDARVGGGLDLLDQGEESLLLRSAILDTVVVDVQLDVLTRGGDRGGGVREGLFDVAWSHDIVEDCLAHGGIVVNGLVDDIPGVAASGPVRDECVDMELHGGGKGCVGPVAICDPVGELLMPDEVVAADQLAVGLGDVERYVAAGVAEDALLGLGELPLGLCHQPMCIDKNCKCGLTFIALPGVSCPNS